MDLTRRELLVDGLFLIVGGSAACTCSASEPRKRTGYGCILQDDEADAFFATSTESNLYVTGNEPIIPKSGNKDFDLALAQTLAMLSKQLGVLPGFAYYDDYDGLNAYASPKVRLGNEDGTVLFGQGLLKNLLSLKESPDAAVAAVCAHEFGHVLQYKKGLIKIVQKGQTTVKRSELQADFFAGYFAGRRRLEKPNFPAAVFAATQSNFGDTQTSSPGHHGTNKERGAAVVRGYEVAYKEKKSLSEAVSVSINYVSQL